MHEELKKLVEFFSFTVGLYLLHFIVQLLLLLSAGLVVLVNYTCLITLNFQTTRKCIYNLCIFKTNYLGITNCKA